ncbi:MAG TPA: hypothetical protein VH853_05610 [Polyangia bacterium]|jgi:hypothetical protein|nr:hypothetical protein [Polyangia bacterium]
MGRRWGWQVVILACVFSAGCAERIESPGAGATGGGPGADGQVVGPPRPTIPPPPNTSPPPSTPAPPIDAHVLVNVGGTPACVDYAEATDDWVDTAAAGSQTVDDLLAAGQGAVIGGWVGTAEAPYGFMPQSWLARFDFATDGTYTAAGRVGEMAVPPLYYGDTENCPPAVWSFTDATSPASGLVGDIAVLFSYDTYCALPAWNEGIWSNVRWDVSGLRMRFSFSTGDGYGPIDLDLRRACPND